MSTSIIEVRAATNKEWDELWRESANSTYFHSREWAEIWSSYTNGRIQPAPRLVLFSDGAEALLPLSLERVAHGLAKRFLSSPAGTFGGWLSSERLGADHAHLLCDFLVTNFGNLVWRLNPYDEHSLQAPIRGKVEDETQLLDLSIGFDAIHRRWTKGRGATARKARKARKAGVVVTSASDLGEFETYYEIYRDSLRRWGDKATAKYDWGLFQEICQRKSPYVILWLAVYQGKTVAGALCFYSKNHVVYWHGAALEDYFTLRPVNLLLYEAIKHACEEGYAWFDFNPSGGHEGVRAFKRSFGTESRPSPVVIRRDWRLSIIDAVAGRLKG